MKGVWAARHVLVDDEDDVKADRVARREHLLRSKVCVALARHVTPRGAVPQPREIGQLRWQSTAASEGSPRTWICVMFSWVMALRSLSSLSKRVASRELPKTPSNRLIANVSFVTACLVQRRAPR